MSKEKNRFTQRIIAALLFIAFSIILFANNVTDLFDKIGIKYEMYWIAWIGLIGSTIYAVFRAIKGDL